MRRASRSCLPSPSERFFVMSVPGSNDGAVPTSWFAFDATYGRSVACGSRLEASAKVRELRAGADAEWAAQGWGR